MTALLCTVGDIAWAPLVIYFCFFRFESNHRSRLYRQSSQVGLDCCTVLYSMYTVQYCVMYNISSSAILDWQSSFFIDNPASLCSQAQRTLS